ncbi:BTB/POZ domain-containing adapter for CUL3-mediated RhoA degradation protein 1-like protein [Aphelenchoides avenae]|nr:BTB/POZ domain-containing adapter for CUL3-mediated RhoA degradation protein 1-like protein [Aphelenchus avenae]
MRGDQSAAGTSGDGSNNGRDEPRPVTADKEGLVRLNIGGKDYVAPLDTLLSEDSHLSEMLKTGANCTQDHEGVVHIEYDAVHFDIVMHYLHTGDAPFDRYSVDEVLREARSWRIPGLEVLCESLLGDTSTAPMLQQANAHQQAEQQASTSYAHDHEQAVSTSDHDRRPQLGARRASTRVQTSHVPAANLADDDYLRDFGLVSIMQQLISSFLQEEPTAAVNNPGPLDAHFVVDGPGNSTDACHASTYAAGKEKRQEETFVVKSIGGVISAPDYEHPMPVTLQQLEPIPLSNEDGSEQQRCDEDDAALSQHNEGDNQRYAGGEPMASGNQRFTDRRGSNRWRGSSNVSWRDGNSSRFNSSNVSRGSASNARRGSTHAGFQRGRQGDSGGVGSSPAVDITRVEPSLQLDEDGFPL